MPRVANPAAVSRSLRGSRTRKAAMTLLSLVLVAALWEAVKAIVPDDGVRIGDTLVLPRTSDLAMPHLWAVVDRLGTPVVATAADQVTVLQNVLTSAYFTLQLALIGLVVGAVVGLLLAVLMQRFVTAERTLLPYIVLSQTVPLIAVAPLVVGWGGNISLAGQPWQPWMSVAMIASYLAFFPIAIGALRGLTSPRIQHVELMHCLAAGWWTTLIRLRLPSALPHLLPALRLGAASAVIGAIVAEISTGTRGGIGRLIIESAQQATGDPTRLYAAILGAVVLGLVAAGLVGALELALRRYRTGTEATA